MTRATTDFDDDDKEVDIRTSRLVHGESSSVTLRSTKRIQRRRLTRAERHQIWTKTEGLCYLCRKQIPPKSDWHVEHVLAFSKNPRANDVLSNMLPAHSGCNLSKGSLSLTELIRERPNLTLDTSIIDSLGEDDNSMDATSYRELCRALQLKHRIRFSRLDEMRNKDEPTESALKAALRETQLAQENVAKELEQIPTFTIEHLQENSMKPIGEGRFGKVQEAEMRIHGSTKFQGVALKQLKIDPDKLQKEAIFLSRLRKSQHVINARTSQ